MTDEAKWILENLKLPERGVFVEVGAFDGVEGSNTLPFEKMGWRGLCIEADPLNAWKCSQNRKCMTLCAAISYRTAYLAPFNVDLKDRGLSGLDREPSGQVILMPLLTLEGAVSNAFREDRPMIDVLSIDTEGTELDVWNSRCGLEIRIVIIEHNTLGKPSNKDEVMSQLTSDGYVLKFHNNVNLIFEYAGNH